MKHYFPPINQSFTYLQSNRSDLLGSIWSSFNLDFQSNLGKLRLANKLVTNTTSAAEVNLGEPVAFEFFSGRWWSICGSRIFVSDNSDATSDFDEDTSTGAITTYDYYSDLAQFDNRLWACTNGILLSKTSVASSWTDQTGAANINGDSFKLAYFKKFNRLYFVEGNYEIGSIDENNTVAVSNDYYIDLGDTIGLVSTIVTNSAFVWIGTTKESSGTDGAYCEIAQWDGISAQVTNSFRIDAAAILSMYVHNDIPYAVDSNGRVLKYTGYSFEEVQRLPIDRIFLIGATDFGSSFGRFIHQNGFIASKNDTLLLNINNHNDDNDDTINENLPSGIWELDLSTLNFTHKYSYTLKARTSSSITDYGQNRVFSVGAIKNVTIGTDDNDGQPSIIAGCKYYIDATSTRSAIFVDSPAAPSTDNEGQKRGYFVTTFFPAEDIQDSWTRLWATHRLFLNSTDDIEFKYRLSQEDPTYIDITWTSTTTFTTTTNITTYGPAQGEFSDTIGGEVEIIQGTGSGDCVHITEITESMGTYTVTLENEVTGATGTAKARLQKWIKLIAEDADQINAYKQINIDDSGIEAQFKGFMKFTGNNEFYKMVVYSSPDITSNQ